MCTPSCQNKPAETYEATRIAIRANIGQEAADVDRLAAIDFEVAAIGPRPQLSLGCGAQDAISIWGNRSTAKFSNSAYIANTMQTLSSNCGRR